MDLFEDIIKNIWVQRTFWSIIVIFIAIIFYRLITRIFRIKENHKSRLVSNKKNQTFLHVVKSVIGWAIGIITSLTILQIFGVNVSSMLAGVGIASVVIGFALQDALKDVIRGLDIIAEDYFEIGDTISYGENIGPVISMSLLTTKLQDVNTMNIVSIANRNIDKVEKVSTYLYLPIPFSYDIKVSQAEAIISEIVKALPRQATISDAAYQGVTTIGDSALSYQVVINATDPANFLQTRRDALGVIMKTLESHGIQVPYNQLDIHPAKPQTKKVASKS